MPISKISFLDIKLKRQQKRQHLETTKPQFFMNCGFEILLRGLWRIRTAVDGFADHCLATRPRDPFLLKSDAKISK